MKLFGLVLDRCYSGNSVWTINKKDNAPQISSRNIEIINSINYYYDIKTGDLFTTSSSLVYMIGFLDDYQLFFEGTKPDYNNMNIYKPDGKPTNKTVGILSKILSKNQDIHLLKQKCLTI